MSARSGNSIAFGFCLIAAVILSAACNQVASLDSALPSANSALPGPGSSATDSEGVTKVSEGRINAARLLEPGSSVAIAILQRDMADITHSPAFPFGDGGVFTEWDHKFAGFVPITLDIAQPPIPPSEYDLLFQAGETEYVLSMRSPQPAPNPENFSQIEFDFRAVNPRANGHVPGVDYLMGQADFPSNDDVVANRSLIDLNGGDVAIVVRGLTFNAPGTIQNTTAYMNGLGPTAWLAFMRDNGLRSGRFFAIAGAWTGAPQAYADTPSPLDDGLFRSVQLNGSVFDNRTEPFVNKATFEFGPGDPQRPYAFMDMSNIGAGGQAQGGCGGFIFLMRRNAFNMAPPPVLAVKGVVVDPSVTPPAEPDAGNLIAAPTSGYDEFAVPAIAPGAWRSDNSGGLIRGVHEISLSVFFVHALEP